MDNDSDGEVQWPMGLFSRESNDGRHLSIGKTEVGHLIECPE